MSVILVMYTTDNYWIAQCERSRCCFLWDNIVLNVQSLYLLRQPDTADYEACFYLKCIFLDYVNFGVVLGFMILRCLCACACLIGAMKYFIDRCVSFCWGDVNRFANALKYSKTPKTNVHLPFGCFSRPIQTYSVLHHTLYYSTPLLSRPKYAN